MWLSPNHEKGYVLFPGFDGGGEWGGAAYDPESQWLFVNSSEMPWLIDMVPNIESGKEGDNISGSHLYVNNCAICHGFDRKGNTSAFPSLLAINKKYTIDSLTILLKRGRGAMPSFAHLSEEERKTIIAFITGDDEAFIKKELSGGDEKLISPYIMKGYKRFLTKEGYPGINPPWGTLNAIDLNTGKIVWKSVLGEFPELTKKGIPLTGREGYGGPVVTAGGLIFIAATEDEMFRAFDKNTGEILWETKLPASGHATPAVYELEGKQYVVIACGGGKGSKSGDVYMAYSLP
jgi:quinoprotein glucose dehydrogenase